MTCSLSDREITMCFQYKKRNCGVLPAKKAVLYVGHHEENSSYFWVLSCKLHIDEDGDTRDDQSQSCTQFVCTAHPSTRGIQSLGLDSLQHVLKHNFNSGVLALGGGAMEMHYSTTQSELHHLPVPSSTGPSGTGKTTALKNHSPFAGGHINCFFSRGMKESTSKVATGI